MHCREKRVVVLALELQISWYQPSMQQCYQFTKRKHLQPPAAKAF
jgi:hypothetical protein